MLEVLRLLKHGNKSAMLAAIVNAVISIIKGIAFSLLEMWLCLLKLCIVGGCCQSIFLSLLDPH